MSIPYKDKDIKSAAEHYQDRIELYNKSVRALHLLRIAIEKMDANEDVRFMRPKDADELCDTLYYIGNSIGYTYDFNFQELE